MLSNSEYKPKFITEVNAGLLKKNPSLWSTRIVSFLFYFIVFATVLTALCAFLYRDAREDSSVGTLTSFLIIISIIGFIVWLIFLLRFNVFKRFGQLPIADGVVTYICYFIITGGLVFIPFIPSLVENIMADRQFSDAELVQDANRANIMLAVLEKDKMVNSRWENDTIFIYKPVVKIASDTDVASTNYYNYNAGNVRATRTEFQKMQLNGDSLVFVNDTTYLRYRFPDLQIINPGYFNYSADIPSRFAGATVYSKSEIFHAAIQYKLVNKEILLDSLEFFKNKYAASNDMDTYYGETENLKSRIIRQYKLADLNNKIDRVADKKTSFEFTIFMRIWYYITLVLSLLVFIFRHSTKKSFFLSFLIATILSIITGIGMASLHAQELGFSSTLLMYVLIFLGISLAVYSAKKQSVLQGIFINLFVFSVPFIPLIIKFFIYYLQKDDYVSDDFGGSYFFLFELGGFVLFLILLEPLIRKLYRCWYALPQE